MTTLPSKIQKQIETGYSKLHYQSAQDINNHFNLIYQKYGSEKDAFLKLLSPQRRTDIVCLGFYLALKEQNFSTLNNALFTYNKVSHAFYQTKNLNKYSNSDSSYILPTLEAYAGNDSQCANYYVHQYGQYAKTGHRYTINLANLCLGIIQKDKQTISQSIAEAQKFLTLKNTIYTQSVINFLVGVIEKDYEKINTSFSQAIYVYPKEKSMHQWYNLIFKYLPIQLFGLIKIAAFHLGKDFYSHFQQPDSDIWIPEFYEILKNGKRGEEFVRFDNKLSFLN